VKSRVKEVEVVPELIFGGAAVSSRLDADSG